MSRCRWGACGHLPRCPLCLVPSPVPGCSPAGTGTAQPAAHPRDVSLSPFRCADVSPCKDPFYLRLADARVLA